MYYNFIYCDIQYICLFHVYSSKPQTATCMQIKKIIYV